MNREEVQISIIIPIYNTEKYLDACIRSVVCQNGCKFEIILVDDGSTDKSREICLKWQQKCSNIHYIYQTNQGQGSARNTGVSNSCGKWLLFLDSDDEMLPNAIEKIWSYIETVTDVDMLWFEYIVKTERGEQNYIQVPNNEASKELILLKLTTVFWDKVFLKQFWEKSGILVKNKYGEDILPVYKMTKMARKVQMINLPMMVHFERGDSLSTQSDKVVQITESIEDTLRLFMENEWFCEHEYELLSMVRKQHRHFMQTVSDAIGNQIQRTIVNNIESLMRNYFPEKYAAAMKYSQHNIVYIGNIEIAQYDNAWFKETFRYNSLEDFFVEGREDFGERCHFIINIENDILSVLSGTRSYEWGLTNCKRLCEEFLQNRKQKGIHGKIVLMQSEKDNEICRNTERFVQQVLECEYSQKFFRILDKFEEIADTTKCNNQGIALSNYRREYIRRDYNFNVMYKWLQLKLQGKSILTFFEEKKYTKIAIYGAGYLGNLLYQELLNTSIQIEFFIDASGIEMFHGIPVLRPKEMGPIVDAVVITILYDCEIIKNNILGCCEMYSIDDVLEEMKEG